MVHLSALALLLLACAPSKPGGPSDSGSPDGGGLDGGGLDGGGLDGGGDTGEPGVALTPWDEDHLYHYVITMDPGDWDALRQQSRNIVEMLAGDCMAAPFPSPYTWFDAQVEIDGQSFTDVSIRKKGLVGSASTTKPGLKLDLNDTVTDQLFQGAAALTLNNGVQDPSLVHQCLAYDLLRDAGPPAPRCAFATVELNGQDLGVYVSVEPVKKPFLEDHFGDGDGALFEGTLSDFRDGWTGTFDPKNSAAEASHAPIDAVTTALSSADNTLLDELDGVIDLDAFFDAWALDAIVSHWDGYAGNTNNFFVYQVPGDGRLVFLPWGMDATFDTVDFYDQGEAHVFSKGALANRLYQHTQGRARYLDHLETLLDTAWDGAVLSERVDNWEALIGPFVLDPAGFEEGLARVRSFIDEQPVELRAELAAGPASVRDSDMPDASCLVQRGEVDATFTTTWGSLGSSNIWSEGTAELHISIDGTEIPLSLQAAVAGPLTGDGNADAAVMVLGLYGKDMVLAPYVILDDALLSGPTTVPIDWNHSTGYLGIAQGGGDLVPNAYLYNGQLVLDQSGTGPGATLRGRMTAELWGGAP